MTITIDNKIIDVTEDKTILDVAQEEGIYIPTLCHYEGVPDDASCMVCVVKNKKTDELLPACNTYVEDGMDIETNSEDVIAFRKKVVKMLLKEHRAECEAPCVSVCPAKYNTPLLHKIISDGMLKDAVSLVAKEIGDEEIQCHYCDARCEKVCNRAKIDTNLSIREIRDFLSQKITIDDNTDSIQKKENDYSFQSKLGPITNEEMKKRLVLHGADGNKKEKITEYLSVSSEAKLCLQCQCSAVDDCQLRDIASKLQIEDDGDKITSAPITYKISISSNLVFESTKCIKCGLCTRVDNDIDSRAALCFKNKGIEVEVSEAIGVDFNNIPDDKAEKFIMVCPTGALHKLQ